MSTRHSLDEFPRPEKLGHVCLGYNGHGNGRPGVIAVRRRLPTLLQLLLRLPRQEIEPRHVGVRHVPSGKIALMRVKHRPQEPPGTLHQDVGGPPEGVSGSGEVVDDASTSGVADPSIIEVAGKGANSEATS